MLRAAVTAGWNLYFYCCHTNHYYYVQEMRRTNPSIVSHYPEASSSCTNYNALGATSELYMYC